MINKEHIQSLAEAHLEGTPGFLVDVVVSDGSNKPYRMRVSTPSFTNVQLIPELIQDLLLADVVVILASIDFVLGDCDR